MSRVLEVRHLCSQTIAERRLLMKRLDKHGDGYRNMSVIMPPREEEKGQVIGLLNDLRFCCISNSGGSI